MELIIHFYILSSKWYQLEVDTVKKIYKAYIILLFIILVIPSVFVLVLPQKDYSESENRYLNQFPKIKADKVLSGKFQEDVSNAFDDQFFIRDQMMELSTSLKKMFGFKDIGGVYIADDNYYITKVTDSDIEQSKFVQNLRYLSYFIQKQNIDTNVYTMLVPSPGTVLKDKLPAFAPFYNSDSMYNTAITLLSEPCFIDIRETLKQQEDSVFFKTDHHWTLKGAYAAYCEYCKKVNPNIQYSSYESFNPIKMDGGFYGTLYSKSLDPNTKPDDIYAIHTDKTKNAKVISDNEKPHIGIYDEESLVKKDKYAYFFGGNYGKTDIETGSDTKANLLVIKDSFANSFIPFLLEDYSHITMIDLRYYNKPISKVITETKYKHILILYEISNFSQDKNIYKLTK